MKNYPLRTDSAMKSTVYESNFIHEALHRARPRLLCCARALLPLCDPAGRGPTCVCERASGEPLPACLRGGGVVRGWELVP